MSATKITKGEALRFILSQKNTYARTCIERIVHDFGDEQAVSVSYRLDCGGLGDSLSVEVFTVNPLTAHTKQIIWAYSIPSRAILPKARTKIRQHAFTCGKKDRVRWVRLGIHSAIADLHKDERALTNFRLAHCK